MNLGVASYKAFVKLSLRIYEKATSFELVVNTGHLLSSKRIPESSLFLLDRVKTA